MALSLVAFERKSLQRKCAEGISVRMDLNFLEDRWLPKEMAEDGLSSVASVLALPGLPEPTVKRRSPNDRAIRSNSVTECSMRALVKCPGLCVSISFLSWKPMSSAEMLCSNHNDGANIDKINIYVFMLLDFF